MKQLKLTIFALVAILFGCQQAELADPNDTGAVIMKTVTISAGMGSPDTKASLDSQTGAFTWQSGDLISVLATDNKFYDFILTSGKGEREAVFEGSIPENTDITTVATYPRIVTNGSDNTVLSGNILNYVLPSEWTHATDVSNVPMVATFGEGAEHMSFKQVGGVMRFPVKNLPPTAQFVMTMADKTITGSFPVDITKLGEGAMVAGTEASVLTINYSSDVDGAYAEFNVPVPTGTYNNFKVEVKDAEGKVLFEKNYSADNTVNRATLLNMKELVLPERPMVISEVWPFFVDARVVFDRHEGITEYAFYVDDAETPVILNAEEVYGGKIGALVGGQFSHNTTHTVAVAKVVDGTPVAVSKSEAVEFKTADMRQLTTNTGTKFVTVGWDDVAIGWGPKWDDETKRWSAVPKTAMPDDGAGLKVHQRRGYQVQLLAADQTTVIYDMIPFDGHAGCTSPFTDSSWIGKKDGSNIIVPTALAFGYLEPGKDYYFRVKTLDEPVMFDVTNGNYNDGSADQPYPYTLRSDRGGCAWSNLIKLSTDAAHVASENEVLYEGFDDIMVHSDYMNWAPAVVPDLETTQRQSWDDYVANSTSTGYPEFLKKSSSERKWTAQAFSEQIRVAHLGLYNDAYAINTEMKLNANAGSLEGWSVNGSSEKRTAYPIFGAIRLGQSGSNGNIASLTTPAFNSEKLREDIGIKTTVKVKVAYCATSLEESELAYKSTISHYRGEFLIKELDYDIRELYPTEWTVNNGGATETEYSHYQQYYELTFDTYLRNGDVLAFSRPYDKTCKGMQVIGEILVEVIPNDYEGGVTNPEDTGIGTEPDDSNYDVYGLGEFPISHWYTVEPWSYTNADGTYNDELTKARYQEMKDAGINLTVYYGHSINRSIEEQMRLLDICEDVGLKFIGTISGGGTVPSLDVIPQIKETLANSDAYVGDYVRDEPAAPEFDEIGAYVEEFQKQMPDKAAYVNLFPDYANPVTQLKSANYEEHIDQYIEKVDTKALSYDYYGLNANGTVTNSYYTNLDLVRSKTLDVRKPFWVITQAGAVGSSRMPNEVEQRWSVWSTIAGGSKGISYFCYWTPSGGAYDASPYMIDLEGNKTEMYYWVKQINADINTIGKKLLPCHADGLIASTTRYYPLFDNNSAGRTKYGPVQDVSAVSEHVAVGCFRDARRSENGENYKGYKVLVTPHQPNKTITTRLTLDSSVTTITVTQNTKSEIIDLNNLTEYTFTEYNDKGVKLTYSNNELTLNIPAGEALLIEF